MKNDQDGKKDILWIIGALVPLIVGCLFAFSIFKENGPKAIWVQIGASVSLIVITAIYVHAARKSAIATESMVKVTTDSLKESKKVRMDSKMPAIALRYIASIEKEDDRVCTRYSTRIVNVGCGPAQHIIVYQNYTFDRTVENRVTIHVDPDLHVAPALKTAFGPTLGPDTGNPDRDIAFLSAVGYTPLHDPRAILLAYYEDIYDRIFVTCMHDCIQSIHSVISREKYDELFSEYSIKASTIAIKSDSGYHLSHMPWDED